MLQLRRGHRDARGRLAEVPISRPRAHHSVLDGDEDVREVHRANRRGGDVEPVKAIAIVDGEHYPDVVREALGELSYDFVVVILIGGTEKLRGVPDYGVPIVEGPGEAE